MCQIRIVYRFRDGHVARHLATRRRNLCEIKLEPGQDRIPTEERKSCIVPKQTPVPAETQNLLLNFAVQLRTTVMGESASSFVTLNRRRLPSRVTE